LIGENGGVGKAVPGRKLDSVEKGLGHGNPRAFVAGQKPSGFYVHIHLQRLKVDARVEERGFVVVVPVVVGQFEGVAWIPFFYQRSAQACQNAPAQKRCGHFRVESGIFNFQKARGDFPVDFVSGLEDLLEHHVAHGHVFFQVVDDVGADGVGERGNGRGDVVPGVGLGPHGEVGPFPGLQADPRRDARPAFEKAGRIVQKGLKFWLDAIVKIPAVQDFGIGRGIDVCLKPGKGHEVGYFEDFGLKTAKVVAKRGK